MRRLVWLALLLPLAASAAEPGRVEIRLTNPSHAAIALVAPRDGTTLIAGTVARLAWRWRDQPLQGVDEWEAFLSLDGGASFGYRVTPHLLIERDEVAFDVPALTSDNVRLMLRFGDEQRETAVVFPDWLRIESSGVPQPGVSTLHSSQRGERALPSDQGVVAWSEGPRNGSHRHRIELTAQPQLRGDIPLMGAAPDTDPFCPEPKGGAVAFASSEPAQLPAGVVGSLRASQLIPARRPSAHLAMVCRRNE